MTASDVIDAAPDPNEFWILLDRWWQQLPWWATLLIGMVFVWTALTLAGVSTIRKVCDRSLALARRLEAEAEARDRQIEKLQRDVRELRRRLDSERPS